MASSKLFELYKEYKINKSYWYLKQKNLENIDFQGINKLLFYLFENCGARRAFFNPGFLRSFLRASLVINPFAFKI